MNALRTSFCLALCLFASVLHAEDWTQFRGAHGAGKSKSTLPVSWTPEANIAWKSELPGAGVSSPIVVGNRVFVTCYSGYGLDRQSPGKIEDLKRHLICFNATSGKKMWQKDIAAALPEDPYTGIGVTAHGYASHTPVSDSERVYVYFGKGGAFAFDLDGNRLWEKSLGKESDPRKWGSSSSPIIHENLVIVTASAESQAIVGLDKETGDEVWRQEASGLDNMWGTPTLVKIDDNRTDLVMSVPREIWGLDPATGKLRWFCKANGADQSQSSPIVGGKTVFAFTGRGGGSIAVRAGGKGDVTDSSILWSATDTARFGSPVGYKSRIYLVANGILKMIDAKSGDTIQQVRVKSGGSSGGRFGGSNYASPVIAGDKLYYQTGSGPMAVFTLGEKLQQVSINLVTTDSEKFGGTPAISNNKMFLRSNKHLYCIADTGDDIKPNASQSLLAKSEPTAAQGNARPGGGSRGRPGNRGGSARGGGSGGRGGAARGGSGRGGPGRGGFGRGGGEDNRPKRPQRPESAS